MQLERFRLALRPRGGWETVDLGMSMVRQWWKPLYGVWLLGWLPFSLLIYAMAWSLEWEPIWAFLLLWWLKPMLSRPLLAVLSGAVFDQPPTLGHVLRRWPRLLWHSGLLGALLFRRLSSARTVFLPVWQLEGQRGRAARQRSNLLGRTTRAHASSMALALNHMALFMALGLFMLVALFVPSAEAWRMPWDPLKDMLEGMSATVGAWLFPLLMSLLDSLLEPYFVAGGFSLYLQRRTVLEGWDLEIAFRRIGQRLQQWLKHAGPTLLLLLVCSLAMPQFSHAAAEPQEELVKVLDQADIKGKHEAIQSWQFVPDRNNEEKEERIEPQRDPQYQNNLNFGAEGFRTLVWVIFGVALAFLLYYAVRHWRPGNTQKVQGQAPEVLFGLDVRPESLPDDLPSAARKLIEQGQIQAALSLLYRGALVHWLRVGLEIEPGDTEGDCIRRVRQLGSSGSNQYFAGLVAHWQQLTYAHRLTPAAEAMQLCEQWALHFSIRRSEV